MSAPRRVHRPNHPCALCGFTSFYEFSGKCVHCVRTQAGKITAVTIKERSGLHTWTDKTPVIDKPKENRIMDGVTYD